MSFYPGSDRRKISAEMANCPICENHKQHRIVETHNEFTMLECAECGLQFSDPLEYSSDSYKDSYAGSDANLGKNYQERLDGDSTRITSLQAFEWQEPYKRRVIEYLRREFLSGSPILDVGCGSGVFLAALKEVGLRPYGMDVAHAPIGMLRDLGVLPIEVVSR